MWLRRIYQDEADGGEGDHSGGGGAGEGDKGSEQGGDKSGELVRELQTQMGVLTKAVTLMAGGQQEMQNQVKTLAESIAAGVKKPDENKGEEGKNAGDLFEGVDLEQLDRKEFGALLLTQFMNRLQSHMDGALKPVLDEVGNLKTTLSADLGKRQINEVAGKNADLMEWKDEIATILKETPTMTLGRALVVARSENPEKAKALEKKYAMAEAGGKKKQVPYLSLTPTSRTGNSEDKGGKMKFPEAAERAFEDVLASLGATDFSQISAVDRR